MVVGWRHAEALRAGLVFGLDLEGARRESEATAPEHRLSPGFGWRLERAGRERLELRADGAPTAVRNAVALAWDRFQAQTTEAR